MATHTLSIIAFDDLNAVSGDPLTLTSTTGTYGQFTVDDPRVVTNFTVTDDDSVLDDAYKEQGFEYQELAAPVTINGINFQVGDRIELEFNVTALGSDGNTYTFSYIRIGGINVGLTGQKGGLPQPGVTYTITGSADGSLQPYLDLACFTTGALIETPLGQRPIEDIRSGDLVRTMDDGDQPVLWIGKREISTPQMRANRQFHPIRIRAGVLGNDRDIVVSPQHRMMLSDWKADLHFGTEKVLVAAKALVNGDDIVVENDCAPVTYYHLMFAQHQIIFCEGSPTESFHPKDQPLSSESCEVRNEIQSLFPQLKTHWSRPDYGPTAYSVVKVQLAKAMWT